MEEVLKAVRRDRRLMAEITAWERHPAQPARTVPFPDDLDRRVVEALTRRGITALYSHQAEALTLWRRGRSPVVVTPTASGKSLCYHLPVLEALLTDGDATALYLFPTRALARDQLASLRDLAGSLVPILAVRAYDGDTPLADRRTVRATARVLLTNPDMLHTALLPHHRLWRRYLRGLRLIVLDELHTYSGLFGGHVANVLRRLQRLCRAYGTDPRFVCCSATIADPLELARKLTGCNALELIKGNGAPRGERHFLIHNPFAAGNRSGGRAVTRSCSRAWAARFLRRAVPTIVFARSRQGVELLLQDLHRALEPSTVGPPWPFCRPIHRRPTPRHSRGSRRGR